MKDELLIIKNESFDILNTCKLNKLTSNIQDIFKIIEKSLNDYRLKKEKYFITKNNNEGQQAINNNKHDQSSILHKIKNAITKYTEDDITTLIENDIAIFIQSFDNLLKASVITSLMLNKDLVSLCEDNQINFDKILCLDDSFHSLDIEEVMQKSFKRLLLINNSLNERVLELEKLCEEYEESIVKGKKILNYFSFDQSKQFNIDATNNKEEEHNMKDDHLTNRTNKSQGLKLKQNFKTKNEFDFEVKSIVLRDMLVKIMTLLEGYEYKVDKRILSDMIINLVTTKQSKTKTEILITLNKYLNFNNEQIKKLGLSTQLAYHSQDDFVDNSLEACYETTKELISFLNS